ncbi:MAG TPA: RNA polymerase sigma factor, partial [Gaiellaceae bacterium]|nr:RNA polymerase sigma factor [Gaiellaceae bacterium]
MAAVPSTGRASLVESQPVAPQASATRGLYERHAAKIHGYCLHQLGSREEAEDAVQTTFMNAFRALGKGVVPETEAAWLFKIAENVCLSRRRSSWRRNRIESPADFELIEELVPGPNRQRDELIGIEDALAAMPGQQRRAILLREWQGLSYSEISAELELSQSAVETLIFRARRSLAQGLTEPERVRPQRRRLRRTLHLADLTTLLAAAKSLLVGSAALKATTAAVVVTAAAGTAVTVSHSDS